MASPLKALIYARVSTSHHDQKPEAQIHELRRYCESRGWVISRECIDHGYSGGTDKRPALNELFRAARSREVDVVVVTKLDRLFRSLKHLVVTLEEFDALKIQFVAIRDSVDWTTPAGRFFTQILGSLGEFEKALLRERTIAGLDFARSKGKILGRPKIRNDIEINYLRSQGLSYTEIQHKLKISRGAVYRALKAISKTPSKISLDSLVISKVRT